MELLVRFHERVDDKWPAANVTLRNFIKRSFKGTVEVSLRDVEGAELAGGSTSRSAMERR